MGWAEAKSPKPAAPVTLFEAVAVAPRLLMIGAAMTFGVRQPEAEAIATVVMGEYAAAPVTVESAYELMRRVQELAGRVGT